MRRLILLMSVILVPIVVLADSDFGGIGGVGTGFTGSFTGNDLIGFTLTMELNSISSGGKTITGALGTITIQIGPLSVCGPGERCFSVGSIDIVDNSNATLFHGTFSNGGNILETCNQNASAVCWAFDGFMPNGLTVAAVNTPNGANSPAILSSDTIVSAVSAVSAVPEPSSFLLLGTGLVGIFGKIYRGLHR
jgi:PEP-CTERM motif-containing protein